MKYYSDATREHVAWLLWCANQGYILAEDRAVLNGGPETFVADMQHPEDRAKLPGWLDMADQVLAAIDTETSEFRVGDRVREKRWGPEDRHQKKVGTVMQVNEHCVFVQWDSGEVLRPDILELVPPDEDLELVPPDED